MDSERKNMNATINLPVGSVLTLIDANDKNAEVGIEKAFEKCKANGVLHSVNTQVWVDVMKQLENKGSRLFDRSQMNLIHEPCDIIRIDRKPVEKTNDLKFFNIKLEFSTGNIKEFILPSYVKFYSSMRGQFFPIEFIRNRDILLDYTGNIVKVDDASLVENYELTDYYSIHVIYKNGTEVDEDKYSVVNEYNFYLNGILTNISYNNFQKKIN